MSRKQPNLAEDLPTPAALLAQLRTLPPAARYGVALSGGVDSMVLLDLLDRCCEALAPADLFAIHVHHGLQAPADAWALHCQREAERRRLPLRLVRLELAPPRGASLEAHAREARYAALAAQLQPGDLLLTGHHRDDQLETFLLQALRGAGPAGLAAMPALAPLGAGWLGRPLLGWERTQLLIYAQHRKLAWVEDASNASLVHDRNYLRQLVVPQLKARWPAASATLSRSAELCAQSQQLQQELATLDLAPRLGADGSLNLVDLELLSAPRIANLLRGWLQRQGYRVPSARQLEQIQRGLLDSATDAQPCISWGSSEVHRYRGRAYVMKRLPPKPALSPYPWQSVTMPFELPPGLGHLSLRLTYGAGLALAAVQRATVSVGFRRGGERLRLPGRQGRHELRDLFQARGVLPWLRPYLPLLFLDGQLAAVADLWVAADFAAAAGEAALILHWQRPRDLCVIVDNSLSAAAESDNLKPHR